MITSLISRLVILTCGTLYPAYRSYKAVKTKNVRDYVKWMMYWIVFALFLSAETVADVFVSWWMPFYYEVKIVFLLWLLSPYTKGSSILYRRFVHPMLTEKENEIDDVISRAKQEGYRFIFRMGSQGLTMLTTLALQLVTKGPSFLDQLRGNFDNEQQQRSHPAIASPRQPQEQLQQQHQHVQQRHRTVHHREEAEMEVRDGRRQIEPNREMESDFEEFGDGLLPDVPPPTTSAAAAVSDGGATFRVPEVPSAAAGDRKTGATTTTKATRKRAGKSPGRTASTNRNNADKKNDHDRENVDVASTAGFSDASDFDDLDEGDSERKSGKKRDANANNVVKGSRGRRPAAGTSEVPRDRSKTKIPKSKSKESNGSSRLVDVRFDDLDGDEDLVLLSSDDEGSASRKGKTKTNPDVARNRKPIKKKTPTNAVVMNEESAPMEI